MVRELFTAEKFINNLLDEIDAIGRRGLMVLRVEIVSSKNFDEVAELDGFDNLDDVKIIAATIDQISLMMHY